MNFKKYHVSRNLLSEKYENRSINGVGAFTIDGNYDLWIGEVVAGQTYAISNMNYVYGFFTAKPLPNTGATYNGSRGYETQGTAVVTVPSGCTWIAVRVLHNADNAMCNTGSNPLPYEPYSSEVWHDTPHYVHKTDTDTLTTLPAVLYPTGTTATVGLKGQAVQSGTPSSSSPVMPQGTGERTGNLWNEDYTGISGNLKYVPVFVGDGTFTLSTDTPDYSGNAPLFLLSGNVTSGASTPTNGVYNGVSRTKESLNGYITIAFRRQSASTDPTTHKTMLNTGSTALPYEPYGYKLTISSDSTTTPVYLGEVETTRVIKKLVLTGGESWQLWNGNYFSSVIDRKGAKSTIVCSHFINSASNGISYNPYDSSALKIAASAVPFVTSVSELKAWLAAQYAAGTPVTVWYVLATETTGTVNEPLMKIGDYADEVSNVSIPVTAGGDTISVGTTIQPSEVTANYHGWHPVADVHERTNGAWT